MKNNRDEMILSLVTELEQIVLDNPEYFKNNPVVESKKGTTEIYTIPPIQSSKKGMTSFLIQVDKNMTTHTGRISIQYTVSNEVKNQKTSLSMEDMPLDDINEITATIKNISDINIKKKEENIMESIKINTSVLPEIQKVSSEYKQEVTKLRKKAKFDPEVNLNKEEKKLADKHLPELKASLTTIRQLLGHKLGKLGKIKIEKDRNNLIISNTFKKEIPSVFEKDTTISRISITLTKTRGKRVVNWGNKTKDVLMNIFNLSISYNGGENLEETIMINKIPVLKNSIESIAEALLGKKLSSWGKEINNFLYSENKKTRI